MTILDSLALTAMAVVLAALLHVSGIVSLNLSPVAHAVTGVPVVQVQEPTDTPTEVLVEEGADDRGPEAVVSRR